MNLKRQKEKKQTKDFKISRIFASIKYSWEGLVYAYSNEQSLLMHGIGTLIIVIIGFILNLGFFEWVIIIISSVVVLSIELLNTAIEATVDMVTKEFNPLAKIAKDCASASAFMAATAYILIAGFIFLNHVLEFLG